MEIAETLPPIPQCVCRVSFIFCSILYIYFQDFLSSIVYKDMKLGYLNQSFKASIAIQLVSCVTVPLIFSIDPCHKYPRKKQAFNTYFQRLQFFVAKVAFLRHIERCSLFPGYICLVPSFCCVGCILTHFDFIKPLSVRFVLADARIWA